MNLRLLVVMLCVSILMGCGGGSGNGENSTLPRANSVSSLHQVYKFDETTGAIANNSADSIFNGTINGATRVAGKIGNALQFGSPGARVEVRLWVPDTTSIIFQNNTVSMDAWVKLDPVTAGSIYHVAGSGDSGLKSFRLQINSGKIEFLLSDNSLWRSIITGNQFLSENTWHHIAVTYDGNVAVTYVDGVRDNSAIVSFEIPTNYNNIYIGSIQDSFTAASDWHDFHGIIDELRISTDLLSATDIANYYQTTVGGG